MKQFKKIAIAVVGTVLFFVVLDIVGGLVCDKLRDSSKSGLFAKQNYLLNSCKDDIIILGSSRAAHHYIPSLFEDSLKVKCFNAGVDGQCIYYNYAILSTLIEREVTPKLVIYEFVPKDVLVSETSDFTLQAALNNFKPYFGKYVSIDHLFTSEEAGTYESICLYSNLYKYNSNLGNLLSGQSIGNESKGYEPLYSKMKDFEIYKDAPNYEIEIERNKIEFLKSLISITKDNGIKLIMVLSPNLQNLREDVINIAKKLCEENDVCFVDWQRKQELLKADYFSDSSHMNDKGAKAFTGLLIQEIFDNKF